MTDKELLKLFIQLRNESIKSQITGDYSLTSQLFSEFLEKFNKVNKLNLSKKEMIRILFSAGWTKGL